MRSLRTGWRVDTSERKGQANGASRHSRGLKGIKTEGLGGPRKFLEEPDWSQGLRGGGAASPSSPAGRAWGVNTRSDALQGSGPDPSIPLPEAHLKQEPGSR